MPTIRARDEFENGRDPWEFTETLGVSTRLYERGWKGEYRVTLNDTCIAHTSYIILISQQMRKLKMRKVN